ncbi:MAG: hypothetical protein HDT33_06340 [Clostridiales bacterium]|nr:hypothetical protein [Clostridiales bacterium]
MKFRSSKDRERSFERKNFYAQYFEGYSTRETMDHAGRRKVDRVYMADFYQQKLSGKQRILLKAIYSSLYFLSVGLFLLGSKRSLGNFGPVLVIFQAAALIGFCLVLCNLIVCLTSAQDMTIYEYKISHLSLPRTTGGTAAILGLLSAASALSGVMGGREGFIHAALYLLALLPILSICVLEKRVPYGTRENDSKRGA